MLGARTTTGARGPTKPHRVDVCHVVPFVPAVPTGLFIKAAPPVGRVGRFAYMYAL